MKRALLCLLACATLGCALGEQSRESLARAEADSDFESYKMRRVGLLPFAGRTLDRDHGHTLQAAFLHEFAKSGAFEVVMLDPQALHEVERSEPYRRGRLKPRTVLELAERYSLDGILIGTVTHMNAYPPQVLGLEIDLVSTETGLPIWSSRLQIDASDAQVRDGIKALARRQERTGDPDGGTLALISPTRFARFAASEVARTLPTEL